MAGVPEGYKRVNLNMTEESYDVLVYMQQLLGRTQASIIRQALLEFVGRNLPQGTFSEGLMPPLMTTHGAVLDGGEPDEEPDRAPAAPPLEQLLDLEAGGDDDHGQDGEDEAEAVSSRLL